MSLWFEIILTVFLPIIFILGIVFIKKLNHIITINNGIFKQNNKIYKHIMLSGLLDLAKDMFLSGKQIIHKRKKKNDKAD